MPLRLEYMLKILTITSCQGPGHWCMSLLLQQIFPLGLKLEFGKVK
jgi:hypothetical protein